MIKNYKAVIFDLDGVICNTDKYHYYAWKKIAHEIGAHFDENINERLRGISRRESLEIILESHSGKISEEDKLYYTEKKNQLYRQLLEGMSNKDVTEEVKDTLEHIRDKGIKIAIGSSSKNTKFVLKKIGMSDYFDAVSDGNNITHSKPDPEVFLKASEYLGINPNLCLVVEDAKSGIEAAIAANMDCAAMGKGTSYNLAMYNLKSISDLINIL